MDIIEEYKIITKVFSKRLYEIDLDDPVAVSNLLMHKDDRNRELDNKIRQLQSSKNDKPLTPKQIIKILKGMRLFTKKQYLLLKALSSCKPINEKMLIRMSKTKNLLSLKTLISITKKRIKECKGEELLEIVPLYGKPYCGYKLKVNTNLI